MSIRNGGKIIAGIGGGGGGNGESIKNQNPVSNITKFYDWIGTLEEYETQRVAELHPTWVCFILDDNPQKNKNLYTNRNVGDIFFTSRLDEELNGAVECNGATYSFEDFTGNETVERLFKKGKLPFVSLSEYETLLSTNGVVGVFGWDGKSKQFRVPTVKDIFLEAGDATNIGEFVPQDVKLPNITGNFRTNVNISKFAVSTNGAFYNKTDVGSDSKGNTGNDMHHYDYGFDASRSSDVYSGDGTDTLIQPKSVKYRAMVQIVVGFADEAVELCRDVRNDIKHIKSSISNCITEIPEDIKLTLEDGTLTLKAGSKVYIPNGFEEDGTTKHFDTMILPEDVSNKYGYNDIRWFVYTPLYNKISGQAEIECYSGDTQPSDYDYMIWYDTANNLMKITVNGGETWVTCSLPFAIIQTGSGEMTNIDQIFNGFGYIDSELFILPGVKCLIPDGRNEDGTLNNIEVTNSIVQTRNFYSDYEEEIRLFLGGDGYPYWWGRNHFKYDEKSNYNVSTRDQDRGMHLRTADVGSFWIKNGKITKLKPYSTIHTVDYNEYEEFKNTVVTHNNISNCITKIPQDIKLSLNNGVLTLKAGSKVYIPNGFKADGSRWFVCKEITRDISATFDNNNPKMLFVKGDTQELWHCNRDTQNVSGATASLSWGFWYDTENNIIKMTTDGSTWKTNEFSLPIGLATGENGSVSNIDLVFNGMGYMGQFFFVLPGIEYLHANGLNEDGSYRNDFCFENEVCVNPLFNFGGPANTENILIKSARNRSINIQQKQPDTQFGPAKELWKYNRYTNEFVYTSNGDTTWVDFGTYTHDGTKVTSFKPRTVFQAVDYTSSLYDSSSSSSTDAHFMGIDTSSAISRTRGTEYTATRDCWVFHNENADNTSYFYVDGVLVYTTNWHSNFTSAKGSALVFVAKGQKYKAVNGASLTEFGILGG